MFRTGAIGVVLGLSGLAIADDESGVLHPDARGAAVPDRTFDLEALHLSIEVKPASRAIEGTATYRAKRISAGPMVLDQVGLAFSSVTVGGEAVEWRVLGDTIEIPVPATVARGASVEVAITYGAQPEKGLHFREVGGGSPDAYAEVWSQGQRQDNRHWFPTWDHPNERFDYTGEVRAPAGWKTHTNSGNEMPAYLVMLAAGPYKVLGEPDNQVWVGPRTPDFVARAAMAPVPSIVDHIEKRTGVAYPWNALRQFFVQRFLYGGMENTAAIINTDDVLSALDVSETRDRLLGIVAHEIAHQWYGDLLTCRTWRDLWLNEGFASFMEGDWIGARDGPDRWADEVWHWIKASQSERPLAGRFHHGPDAPRHYNVYAKGAMVLQMLRVMLGEDVFWSGIQHYTQANRHGLVETVDLQRSMEHVSGQELGWFFQQWVELPTVPRLTVTRKFADGRLEVRVKQKVSDARPAYTLLIDIEVGTADGPIRRREWMEDNALEMEFELEAPPTYVAFDPSGGVLAEVDDKQAPEAWEAQLQSPSHFAVRRAIAALADTEAAEGLAAFLGDEERGFLERGAAARALGAQRRTDLLSPHLRADHGRVRQAVVAGMGKGKDTAALGKLESIARSDPNPDIRAAALLSVAKLSSSRGAALARTVLRSARGDGHLARRAADVLGEHGSPADVTTLLSAGTRKTARNSGLWAAGRIVGRQDPGTKRDAVARTAARALERLLYDLDYKARAAAVGLLGEVGDERSVPQLEALRRATSVASLAERARTSIRRIRSREDAVEVDTPSESEARMDDLEERIKDLEKELEKWRDRH